MAILRVGKPIGVCVHHSVYKPANNLTELKAQATLFNGWHKSKSWAEETKTNGAYPYISYHYLIGMDGSLLKTTDEIYVKYHSGDNFRKELSFNLHGIAVCLTGNYETDKPTEAQMLTLVKLIRDIQSRYKIDAMVRAHKETSQTATACAGKNVGTHDSGWLKQVIANVNNSKYPPVEAPSTPNCEELAKTIGILQTEVNALTLKLGSAKEDIVKKDGDIKLLEDRVLFLEETMAIRDKELKDMESENTLLREAKERFEKQYIDTVTELNELKKGRDDWINKLADMLHKLFGMK